MRLALRGITSGHDDANYARHTCRGPDEESSGPRFGAIARRARACATAAASVRLLARRGGASGERAVTAERPRVVRELEGKHPLLLARRPERSLLGIEVDGGRAPVRTASDPTTGAIV